ncbi:MAG: alpha-galactosidase, partial [Verrucomicrobia bacterium]|nr:alpha-galactosidase [Verrucomicrobiota bacterium]
MTDGVFGAGSRIVLTLADGGENSLTLCQGLPFVLVRAARHNSGTEPLDLTNSVPAVFTLDLGKPAGELRTMGTAGLTAPDQHPGSYLFLTLADPATRRGVVAGWLTEDRGSGVVFSSVKGGAVEFKAQIDYGHLRILPGASAKLETLAVGLFEDARLGEELYADAIKQQYKIKLRPQTAVYCSWYAEKHGEAGDEQSTIELAKFVAKELKPFGFGIVQIDDEWQDGPKLNGPRRGFDRVRPDGPYAHGIAPVAEEVEKLGLTFGLWWLPFGRNYQDPEYKDRQHWFARRPDGKPYDTAWGGTCLDLTQPEVKAHLVKLAKVIRSWGVRYYKMDGLWTGAVCEQIYVNDGFKDDHFGNNLPLFDPLKSNIEAYRDGLKLIRANAGDDVFFSGCCVSQNMRELCAIGLVDSMRIGPDYNADGYGTKTGPLRGSRLYFLNGRVWWNDPDPCIVRASGEAMGCKPVSLDQARQGASWVAIAGQFYLNSDWIPALPVDRLDVMKRTMSYHGATARPVDYFENAMPRLWLVTDTRQPVRRDVLGLFNWETNSQLIACSAAKAGLDPASTYHAFDFWANQLVPDFKGNFEFPVPAQSCRVIAVRSAKSHPVLLSTSRHVSQGILEVTGEMWSAAAQTLSGVSQVVGQDPYELRIAGITDGGKFWKAVAAMVSAADEAAGVTITMQECPGLVRVLINSPIGREVRWGVQFKPLAATGTKAASDDSPRPGDADFPTAAECARHTQKVAALKAGNYDLFLIGDSITQTVGDADGEWAPLKAV